MARDAEAMQITELFNTGETSPLTQRMLARAAILSHKGEQGGKGNRVKGLTGDDFIHALNTHADNRMKAGKKHPRPGWQKGIRKILGISNDPALIRWMESIGKSRDDAEKYLNEKFESR